MKNEKFALLQALKGTEMQSESSSGTSRYFGSKNFKISTTITAAAFLVPLILSFTRYSTHLEISIFVSAIFAIITIFASLVFWLSQEYFTKYKNMYEKVIELRKKTEKSLPILKNLHEMGDVELTRLLNRFTNLLVKSTNRPIFHEVFKDGLQKSYQSATDLIKGSSLVILSQKPKNEFNQIFSRYLRALRKQGGFWLTVSNLEIWSDKNLGKPNEFLDTNLETAAKNVKIERVFILPDSPGKLTVEEKAIWDNYVTKTKNVNNIETFYVVPDNYVKALENFGNFAWLATYDKADQLVLLLHYENFQSERPYKFKGLEIISNSEKVATHLRNFEHLWNASGDEQVYPVHLSSTAPPDPKVGTPVNRSRRNSRRGGSV